MSVLLKLKLASDASVQPMYLRIFPALLDLLIRFSTLPLRLFGESY
jgi:hypothetical protein